MERKPSLESSLRKSLQKKREEMNLADFQLTTSRSLSPGQLLPLVIEPAIAGVNLASWAGNNKDDLGRELVKHGEILLRNFAVDSPAKFEAFARAVSADGDLFDEYGDLPREDKGAKVYGSTPYPARQVCPAVVRHPQTGEMLFFNQIQLHHISCLDPDVRASLLSMFREEDLPRNVYYGDGTRIEDAVVAEISALYEQQAVRFQWQAGDVIIVDNMRVAHARDPFEGTRKVLVAMAEVVLQRDLARRR